MNINYTNNTMGSSFYSLSLPEDYQEQLYDDDPNKIVYGFLKSIDLKYWYEAYQYLRNHPDMTDVTIGSSDNGWSWQLIRTTPYVYPPRKEGPISTDNPLFRGSLSTFDACIAYKAAPHYDCINTSNTTSKTIYVKRFIYENKIYETQPW